MVSSQGAVEKCEELKVMINSYCGKIIRETLGICQVCRNKIHAYLIEADNKIYIEKKCSLHGTYRFLLSRHSWYYVGLTKLFFEVMPARLKQGRYYIYLSNKCNMNCPVCLLEPNQNNIQDISLGQCEEIIKKNRTSRFFLYGAEPTLLSNIEQWIQLLKRYGNFTNIHTNGIKLINYEYLKTLKNAGLDYVSLQFDGFDDKAYNILRGQNMLDIKLKALENLRRLNIPIGLNVTVAKDVNEGEMNRIIEYAIDNPFIREVSFVTLSFVGSANKNFSPNEFITSDDLIDIVEKQSEGKISRKGIYLFQKLYYVLLSIFNMRRCCNFQHIAFIRDKKNRYYTFDALFKLEHFEKYIDTYGRLVRENKRFGAVYIFLKLFINFVSSKFLVKLKCIPFNVLWQWKLKNITIPSKVLLVSFGSVCDFYTYDCQATKYCSQGFCFRNNDRIELKDSIPDFSLFYIKNS